MSASAYDAHPFAIYGARFRLLLPLLDNDGDPVTGALGPDSKLSVNCATIADATNEVSQITSSGGGYYLDLTSAELTCKSLYGEVKTSTTDAKTTPFALYPRRLPVIRTGTVAGTTSSTTVTLDSGSVAVDSYYVGCYINLTNNTPSNALGQARKIISYVGSTKVATIEAPWATSPNTSTTFEILLTEDSFYVLSDIRTIVGAAVATGTAQLGVNVVSYASGQAPLQPTTAGRTLDVSTGGEAGIDLANVGSPTTTLNLSGTTIATTQKVDVETIKANPVVNAGTITFPTGATLASTTNITSGTITNLTNAPTTGDLTATMKASVTTAATAATPTLSSGGLANITAWSVAITGNISGNLSGSVGSVTGNVGGSVATLGALPAAPTDWLTAAAVKADAVTKIQSGLALAATALSNVVWTNAKAAFIDAAISSVGGGGSGGLTEDQADQLQAIFDATSSLSGSGAYTITTMATDGTSPVAGARVRVTSGINTYTDISDVDGLVQFALDAGTFNVSVVKDGYSFTPTTRTVTGNETGTLGNDLVLAAQVIPAPSDPSLCLVFGYIDNPGVTVTFTLVTPGAARDDSLVLLPTKVISTVTDSAGFLSQEVTRTDAITPAGAKWLIECPAARLRAQVDLTSGTFDISTLIT